MYKAEWQPCRQPQLLSGMPDVTLVAPPCPKYKTPLPLWLLRDKLFLSTTQIPKPYLSESARIKPNCGVKSYCPPG